MRNLTTLILVSTVALLLAGCAGQAARNNVLGPTMAATWPEVKGDAELGVKARENPTAAAALEVENIGPGVASLRRERITKFDQAVTTFNAPR